MAFAYKKMFDYGKDKTAYRLLTDKHVKLEKGRGGAVLKVAPQALTLLAAQAFHDIAFFLRPAHLKQVASILGDKGASDNDRFVALALLKNAVIASEEILPMCQDTGTANVAAWKGDYVRTGIDDVEALSKGVYDTYTRDNLRYSQMAPLSMFEDVNTRCNLPAQADIASVPGEEYRFLFVAKGGGSSNKTSLTQETPAILNPDALTRFLTEKIKALGVAACPPYHLAVVIGGTSPELCLKTVKLASAGYLDGLPVKGHKTGIAFRDLKWETKVLEIARNTGLGAQFTGKHLALDARVIRLPRHAASCCIGLGISCNADRNIKGKITAKGVFLEKLERNPARFLPAKAEAVCREPIAIDLNRPLDTVRAQLATLPVGTLISLTGPLVVARDMAHAKLKQILDKTGSLPEYFKAHPIYYAGPAKTPEGAPSGSFGPTTAQRMDGYLDAFMKAGASLVTLAKGNRAPSVTESCARHRALYLGTIGGAAALVARENILKSEVLDFEELGMEAVRRIMVKDMPAFVLSDDKGE